MTYFLEFLIFSWLTLLGIYSLDFISHYIKEILYVNRSEIQIQMTKLIQRDIHFHLSLILMLKKWSVLLTLYQHFLISLSITNLFSEAAVRWCSSKWVLLKISQYSELKRDSNTVGFRKFLGTFSRNLNIFTKFLGTLFYRTSLVTASVFFDGPFFFDWANVFKIKSPKTRNICENFLEFLK